MFWNFCCCTSFCYFYHIVLHRWSLLFHNVSGVLFLTQKFKNWFAFWSCKMIFDPFAFIWFKQKCFTNKRFTLQATNALVSFATLVKAVDRNLRRIVNKSSKAEYLHFPWDKKFPFVFKGPHLTSLGPLFACLKPHATSLRLMVNSLRP